MGSLATKAPDDLSHTQRRVLEEIRNNKNNG